MKGPPRRFHVRRPGRHLTRDADMTERTCSIPECDSPVKGRGWCNAHYQRWWKTGDPLGIRPARWDGYERPVCSVDGCEQLAHAQGMCPSHFCRNRRWGDPLVGRRNNATGTPEERFMSFVDFAENGCWHWNGGLITAGYAEFTLDGTSTYGHRWSYVHFIGPITDETLDHTCHTNDLTCPGGLACLHRRCVNPEHLEPVTHVENTRRGWERRRARAALLGCSI